MIRRISIALLVVLCAHASADDIVAARKMMSGAIAELSTQRKFTMVLTGTELDKGVQSQIQITVAVQFTVEDKRQFARVETMSYRDGTLVHRFAGDGQRLWTYDVLKKEYSSVDYGVVATPIQGMRHRLFQTMNTFGRGPYTLLTRILMDAFGENATNVGNIRTQWVPWQPMAEVKVSGENIVCTASKPVPSQLVYVLESDPVFGFRLKGLDYYEQVKIAGRWRTRRWQVTIRRDYMPSDTSFGFVAPRGSRAVSVNIRKSGG